ncbi:MAG: Arabinose-5-phosphate isomerase [Bacteroidota bacterium]
MSKKNQNFILSLTHKIYSILNLTKNIESTAKKVLELESKSISNLVNSINNDFISLVQFVLKNPGRLVISGIGKSAIIGQKIVATLNSTGTPSIFMHAADAIHGDLGMIQKDDIVILISKSGNTPEIKVLTPLVKRLGVKIAALVSEKDSYLAKNSDFVLHVPIEKEADSLNLAPTNSTTASLALGDAFAVCLLEARGFSSKDFAKYHPGGTLGKKLYLKVEDIYPNHEFPVISIENSLKEAIIEISAKRLGATLVLNKDQSMAGIITDGDIRRALEKTDNLASLSILEVLTKNPKSIQSDAYATEALNLMQTNNITQLVVFKKTKPVGFIHLHDLLKDGIV